jgi:hypothetical protein
MEGAKTNGSSAREMVLKDSAGIALILLQETGKIAPIL